MSNGGAYPMFLRYATNAAHKEPIGFDCIFVTRMLRHLVSTHPHPSAWSFKYQKKETEIEMIDLDKKLERFIRLAKGYYMMSMVTW